MIKEIKNYVMCPLGIIRSNGAVIKLELEKFSNGKAAKRIMYNSYLPYVLPEDFFTERKSPSGASQFYTEHMIMARIKGKLPSETFHVEWNGRTYYPDKVWNSAIKEGRLILVTLDLARAMGVWEDEVGGSMDWLKGNLINAYRGTHYVIDGHDGLFYSRYRVRVTKLGYQFRDPQTGALLETADGSGFYNRATFKAADARYIKQRPTIGKGAANVLIHYRLTPELWEEIKPGIDRKIALLEYLMNPLRNARSSRWGVNVRIQQELEQMSGVVYRGYSEDRADLMYAAPEMRHHPYVGTHLNSAAVKYIVELITAGCLRGWYGISFPLPSYMPDNVVIAPVEPEDTTPRDAAVLRQPVTTGRSFMSCVLHNTADFANEEQRKLAAYVLDSHGYQYRFAVVGGRRMVAGAKGMVYEADLPDGLDLVINEDDFKVGGRCPVIPEGAEYVDLDLPGYMSFIGHSKALFAIDPEKSKAMANDYDGDGLFIHLTKYREMARQVKEEFGGPGAFKPQKSVYPVDGPDVRYSYMKASMSNYVGIVTNLLIRLRSCAPEEREEVAKLFIDGHQLPDGTPVTDWATLEELGVAMLQVAVDIFKGLDDSLVQMLKRFVAGIANNMKRVRAGMPDHQFAEWLKLRDPNNNYFISVMPGDVSSHGRNGDMFVGDKGTCGRVGAYVVKQIMEKGIRIPDKALVKPPNEYLGYGAMYAAEHNLPHVDVDQAVERFMNWFYSVSQEINMLPIEDRPAVKTVIRDQAEQAALSLVQPGVDIDQARRALFVGIWQNAHDDQRAYNGMRNVAAPFWAFPDLALDMAHFIGAQSDGAIHWDTLMGRIVGIPYGADVDTMPDTLPAWLCLKTVPYETKGRHHLRTAFYIAGPTADKHGIELLNEAVMMATPDGREAPFHLLGYSDYRLGLTPSGSELHLQPEGFFPCHLTRYQGKRGPTNTWDVMVRNNKEALAKN